MGVNTVVGTRVINSTKAIFWSSIFEKLYN